MKAGNEGKFKEICFSAVGSRETLYLILRKNYYEELEQVQEYFHHRTNLRMDTQGVCVR